MHVAASVDLGFSGFSSKLVILYLSSTESIPYCFARSILLMSCDAIIGLSFEKSTNSFNENSNKLSPATIISSSLIFSLFITKSISPIAPILSSLLLVLSLIISIEIINDKTNSNEDRIGAIGDIDLVIKREKIKDELIIVAGDNLFEFSLKEFVDFSKDKPIIASHDINNIDLAKQYGILSVDDKYKITNFEEKPEKPKSTLAATCIYFLPSDIVKMIDEYIQKGNPTDKPGHFIQWLYKETEVYSFVTKERWFDIGSKEQLERSEE